MSSIVVIARAKAKPGCEAQMEKALRAVVGPTHAEAGCLKYSICRSADDPAMFITVESWSSKEANTQHMSSAHVQALFQKLGPLLSAPPEILAYEPILEGTPQKHAV